MHQYIAYGLTISSEIECPELRKGTGKPDVSIYFGSLGHIPLPEVHQWKNYALSETKMLVIIKGVAKYLVTDGREIIIDPFPNVAEKVIRLFLLGSAFGAILHQRGTLPIHGNGIIHEGESVIFAGRSGIGKSTLAAAFAKRGYEVLSDDVCAIHVSQGSGPLVHPGFPQVKLWSDAAESMGVDWRKLSKVQSEDDKYILPMKESFFGEPACPKHIFFLGFHEAPEFELNDQDFLDGTRLIWNNIYRRGMAKLMGKEKEVFSLCAQLSKQTMKTKLCRPENLFLLNDLIDLVEEKLRRP